MLVYRVAESERKRPARYAVRFAGGRNASLVRTDRMIAGYRGQPGSNCSALRLSFLPWVVRRGAGVFRDAQAGPPRHRNIKPFLRPGGVGGGDRWAGAMAATESGGIPSGPRGPWCSRSRAEDRRALRPTPGKDDRCRRVEALVEILLVS